MDKHVIQYKAVLKEVDDWFATVKVKHHDIVKCHAGCFDCCQGLFDIGLLDALIIQEGLKKKKPDELKEYRQKAKAILQKAEKLSKKFAPPYTIDSWKEDDIDKLVDGVGSPLCPLLDGNGLCTIYEFRPIACRFMGIPLIDKSGEVIFIDGCEKNPIEKEGALSLSLSINYYEKILPQERAIVADLVREYPKLKTHAKLRAFIPAVILMEPIIG